MPTIGQKLEETRRSRGLALEDVARATRIHPSVLARIESDDFSQFPSVSYARSFLRLYGRHLGLDLEEALAALSARDARFSERQLMEEMRQTVGPPRRRFRLAGLTRLLRRPSRRRRRPILLDALLLLLFAAIGLFYFLGYQAPSPEQATEDIARALGLPLPSSAADAAAEAPSAGDGGVAASANVPGAEEGSLARDSAPEPEGIAAGSVAKEAVELPLDDRPAAAGSDAGSSAAPRPRALPGLDLATDPPRTPPAPQLPSTRRVEPRAALRPEGTDPAAEKPRLPEGVPDPAAPSPETEPETGLRAVPVARSR